METLTYLLKANAAIAVFYVVYRLFYRNDTFFTLRRYLLQSMIFLSLIYPLADFSKWLIHSHTLSEAAVTYVQHMPEIIITTPEASSISAYSTADYILWFYALVAVFFVLRMTVGILHIIVLRRQSTPFEIEGIRVNRLGNAVTPFSFFKWIFIHPEMHNLKELHEILAHEQVHVRQHHSFDILLSELFCAICWFNPLAWMLKKEVHGNLEFLADHRVVKDGVDVRSYQYHLLRLADRPTPAKMANQFNTSPLKKRIRMLNSKQSPKIKLAAYTLLLPLALLFLVANNAGAMIDKMSGLIDSSTPVLTKQDASWQTTGKDSLFISGTLVDKQGPLHGVSILVSGTNMGTISDAEGKFQILIHAGDTLAFSYIGFATLQLVPETTGNLGQIEMKRKKENLDEVIVIGYTPSSEKMQDKEEQSSSSEKKQIFMAVEEMPQFPGGQNGLMQYIARNIKYPEEARQKRIQGRVVCQFIIDERGNTSDVQIIDGIDPALDNEATRIIYEMPRWKPGRQRGKAVAVEYTVPINFRLTGKQ